MQTYFLTNITLSAVCCLVLYLLRDASARIRLYVSIAGLVAWFVPWSLISMPSLPNEMAIQQVILPELTFAMPELPVPNLEHRVVGNSALPALPDNWWLLAILAIGLILFVFDVRSYLKLRRYWLDDSVVRNDLWQEAGFTKVHCDIRYLSGTGPGMATGLLQPTIWLSEEHKGALQTILLHELTHIQQRDPSLLWALTLIRRLLWWNPIAYIAVTYARQHIELSCDERCKQQMPDDTYRISLIEILIKNHKQSPSSDAVLGLSFKPKFNLQRIYHLNEDKFMKNKDKATLAVATLLFGWVSLSNASYQNSEHQHELSVQHGSAFKAQLQTAYTALSDEDEVQLNESLDWFVSKMPSLSPAEQGSAKMFMAQYHMTNNEYPEALDILEAMLQGDAAIPASQHKIALKHAADLAMATEQYEKSNEYWLELLANTTTPSANIKADKLAVNYYLLKEYESALQMLEQAYSELEGSEQPLEQKWLKLQMGIHHELGQIEQAATVASDIARLFPTENNQRILREFELLATQGE